MTGTRGEETSDAVQVLFEELALVEAAPSLPRIVVLYGETGRGKTYAVQRFYDELCVQRPGPWRPGLTPHWPPTSARAVDVERKRVVGELDRADDAQLPFFWLGTESYAYGRDPRHPAPTASEQLERMFRDVLTKGERRRKISKQALKAGLDMLFALSSLPDVVSAGKVLYDHSAEGYRLLRAHDERRERREHVRKSFVASARATGNTTPMIVVIDDAQDIDAETLHLLSGLISTAPDTDDEQPNRYLPGVIGDVMPAPLLIVCTVWEHRLNGGAYQEPFQEWLHELIDLGVDITYRRCAEFDLYEAEQVLGAWPGASPAVRLDLRSRIAHVVDERTVVNPLVLSLGVAMLEETRDVVSGAIDEERIASLPVTPEAHIRDRIDRLREDPAGPLGVEILHLCAGLGGSSAPVRFVECALAASGSTELQRAFETLGRHELAVPSFSEQQGGQAEELRGYRLDVDVLHHLSQEGRTHAQAERLACGSARFLEWVYFDLMRSDFSVPIVGEQQIDAQCRPMAEYLVGSGTAGGSGDAAVVARVLTGHTLGDVSESSPRAQGFAYARGSLGKLDDATLLTAFEDCWHSRTSLRIAERRLLDGVSDVDNPTEAALLAKLCADRAVAPAFRLAADVYLRHHRTTEAIEITRRCDAESLDGAMFLADAYARASDRESAIDVLAPFDDEIAVLRRARLIEKQWSVAEAMATVCDLAKSDEHAAVYLANLHLRDGNVDDAAAVLDRLADESDMARLHLARILADADPEKGLTVLAADESSAGMQLKIELHRRLGDESSAVDTLRRAAEQYSELALVYSRHLVASGEQAAAMGVLRPHAGANPNVAEELATLLVGQGAIDEAIEVLRPMGDRAQNAGARLASLLLGREPDEAIRLYERWATNPNMYRSHVLALLQVGCFADALEVLDGRLQEARDPATQTLRIGALMFAGRMSEARMHFTVLDSRTPGAPGSKRWQQHLNHYYRLSSLFAAHGRTDLLGELLRSRHPDRVRVVADFALTAATKMPDTVPDRMAVTCDRLWCAGDASVASALVGINDDLWAWAGQPTSVRPRMTAKAAISCLEVLRNTGHDTSDVARIVRRTVRDDARRYPKQVRMLAYFAELSDVARDVVEAAGDAGDDDAGGESPIRA